MEWSLLSEVDVRAEYNDNIFLTSLPHDSVTAIKITPAISAVVKEENWQAILDASLRSNNYSDSELDSNDQYFNLTGNYNAQRNIYSLNVNHDLDSNLNSISTDFGIAGRRVNRKNQSVTPQYTRLLTERAALVLSYTYADVDYLDAEGTNFTPYVSETATISFNYDLTEKDRLTLSLIGVDYASRNDLITYQLLLSRIGITHEISEILSVDFLVGSSRRSVTNKTTQLVDFVGRPIPTTVVVDSQDRGFVLDAGVTQLFETGRVEGRISRNNTTNSFGGLDQTDSLKVSYKDKISSLWRYDVVARIDDVTAISQATSTTDRQVLFFESKIYYSITPKWDMIASYRYVRRKFKTTGGAGSAPDSNRVYVGLSYNFPSLSTF